jgi:hypothetical protein
MFADFIEVYHAGKRIATTLDAQTDKGYLYFEYDPLDSEVYDLMVRVGNKDFAAGAATQSVYYSLYCVSSRGAREYMHPCGSYEVNSAGHPTTEDVIDLTDIYINDTCGCLIELDAGSFSTTFEVFALENDELLDSASITGLKTNLSYLKRIMHTPDFVKGEYNTLFIEKNSRMLLRQEPILQLQKKQETEYFHLNIPAIRAIL